MANSDQLIVVLGGAGYIGSVLIRRLLSEGYRVRVYDNYLYGRHGVEGLEDENLQIIEGDLCDTKSVSNVIKDADVVVLLAAIVGRRAEDITRADIREVNFLASTVALDAAIEHGVSRFVFASTDSVYGLQSGVMYETGMPDPVSAYSRLKLRMEERVIDEKKRSFHPTALRIATCYGYSPRMRFDLVANSLIRDAVCHQKIDIENGDQARALIHVDDVCSAFISVIQAHVNLVSGEIFNVGSNSQNVTLNQLANIVRGIVPETEINFLGGEADLTNYHLSCSKIEKILDFSPRWTIEQTMRELRDLLLEQKFGDPYSLQYQNT